MQLEPESKSQTLISLTPLIDVVFILLVFFMLSSTFLKWNFVELSVIRSGESTTTITKQSMVLLEAEGRYFLNGKPISLAELIESVKANIDQDNEHPVLVQPADDLPLQGLITVLQELKKIAGNNVSLVPAEEISK